MRRLKSLHRFMIAPFKMDAESERALGARRCKVMMQAPRQSAGRFSPLRLRGFLVLDLANGIPGFAKSNHHSLGEVNAFFVTFRDLVPHRAVPSTGMINESGFDGVCYDDKGVF
jgi:hypothetical protein